MMAGTKPLLFSKSTFISVCLPNFLAKNTKPAALDCAGGPKGALFSGLLCTPQRARRVAVMMMMVPMRPNCVCALHCQLQK